MRTDNFIRILNHWYKSKCNGVWEHSYGFSLESLDNPGWSIKINGESSKSKINIKELTEENWISISANDSEFIGYSSSERLDELIGQAINWLLLTE